MATASRFPASAARDCRVTASTTCSAAPSPPLWRLVRAWGAKKVSPHVLRDSTAMHLFQAGVDMAVIALWLGHESLETTHVYVEADLATKERALEKLAPMLNVPARYRRLLS
jgi:integrase